MQNYVRFPLLGIFCFIFFSVFKLPIRNQNDTILIEGLLGKKPLKEFEKPQGSKTGNLGTYKTFIKPLNSYTDSERRILHDILSYYFWQLFKEATKSYITHYSCMVIIFFSTGLCRSALSTISFVKLLFCLSML